MAIILVKSWCKAKCSTCIRSWHQTKTIVWSYDPDPDSWLQLFLVKTWSAKAKAGARFWQSEAHFTRVFNGCNPKLAAKRWLLHTGLLHDLHYALCCNFVELHTEMLSTNSNKIKASHWILNTAILLHCAVHSVQSALYWKSALNWELRCWQQIEATQIKAALSCLFRVIWFENALSHWLHL